MHGKKLKKIKLTIVLFTGVTVFGMIAGIAALRNNYYWKQRFFEMKLNYAKAEILYAQENGGIQSILSKKDNSKNELPNEQATSVPVLVYHGVINDSNWHEDGVNISLSEFKKQMFALKKAGYHTVTLKDFNAFMKEEKSLPDRSILITFDDGRVDSYYPVDPIFETLDFNGVNFIITGRSLGLGNEKSVFHLSKTELQKMAKTGRWEFGSHTQNGHEAEKIDGADAMGHFLTDKLWLNYQNRPETENEYTQRVSRDLAASKEDLEKKLGIEVIGFAFPFGDYGHNTKNNPESQAILKKVTDSLFPLSFRQTGNSEYPTNYPSKSFRLIKRINMDSEINAEKLVSLLENTREKQLPYSDTFSGDNGWVTGWGNSSFENGLLLTGSSDLEDSSLTFLNGTFSWKNYSVTAAIQLLKGDSFALLSRYNSGNNYATCDFSAKGISITQRVAGEETILVESKYLFPSTPGKSVAIGMDVSSNRVSCTLEGKTVAVSSLSDTLSHGGIGFKTWDDAVNNSSLLVSDLKVTALK